MTDTMRALPDACAVGVVAADAMGVLRQVADLAIRAGHAAPSFGDALVTREHAYPTGLPTLVPVAIPHADPSHVREAGFAVATLARPVPFGVMGTAEDRVDLGHSGGRRALRESRGLGASDAAGLGCSLDVLVGGGFN